MSPVELIALSLGVSIAVAVATGLAATVFERLCADPGLRERVWALALYLPVLPPVLVGGLLLTPAPVRPVLVLPVQTEVMQAAPVVVTDVVSAASSFSPDWAMVAVVVLAIAAGLIAVRGLSLAWRAARLRRLVARATPASEPVCQAVIETARSLGVAAPSVRATVSGADALLTGLNRPMLILPDALARMPHSPAARAVIAHELAHLKRGDHRAVWLEEGVLALMAANPVLPLIRARRAAAREEACDALALTGADPSARRLYAQSLIEALRARTDPMLAVPALTFTGTPRSQAMRRLKSILTPPATAGRGVRVAALLGGLAVLGLSVAGSVALAAQREPSAPLAVQDDGSAAAQSAARAAAAASLASLPPEQQERFRNPTTAEYREICSTGAPTDEGFCSGVLFANLPYKGVTPVDFCPPVLSNGEFDIEAVATKGRQNVVALPVQPGETINGVAKAALRTAFPCPVTAEPMKTVALAAEAKMLLNGRPMAVGLPYWGLAVDRIDVQTAEADGQASMNFVVQTGVTPPVFVDDVRLPDGIGISAIRSDMIESRETAADGSIRVRIKPRPARTSAATEQVSAEKAYAVRTLIAEAGVNYRTVAEDLRGQGRLSLADGRYRMTIDRTAVEPDRVRSDIRVFRKAADGTETVVAAPSMVSQHDKAARFQVGIEGGDLIEVTVGPPGEV